MEQEPPDYSSSARGFINCHWIRVGDGIVRGRGLGRSWIWGENGKGTGKIGLNMVLNPFMVFSP